MRFNCALLYIGVMEWNRSQGICFSHYFHAMPEHPEWPWNESDALCIRKLMSALLYRKHIVYIALAHVDSLYT